MDVLNADNDDDEDNNNNNDNNKREVFVSYLYILLQNTKTAVRAQLYAGLHTGNLCITLQ